MLRHARRVLVPLALLSAMLAPAALVTSPAQSATRGRLKAQYTRVIPTETVVFTATVPAHRRPVVLQRRKGRRWVNVKTTKRYAAPSWLLRLRAPKVTTRYRVHARRAKVKGRWRPAVNTRVVTVRPVRSSVSLSLPATTSVGGSATATATFSPARKGWLASLQVRDAVGVWREVATGVQDAAGRARISVPTSGAGTFTYRVVRVRQKSAPAVASGVRSIRVGSGTTTLVSVGQSGTTAGNPGSFTPAVSANGRLVAFASRAWNLTNDVNADSSVFLRDLDTRKTTMLTPPAAISSLRPSISADGRYVAFQTDGALVPSDSYGSQDVYVIDRQTHTYTLVSSTPSGDPGNANSTNATISADGRHVLFRSFASDLVAGDTNGQSDAFVRDLDTGTTERVSVSSTEAQGDRLSDAGDLSADGRLVVFSSAATNLVPDDTNEQGDVFLRDRDAGTTVRISQSDTGVQGDLTSNEAVISDDGRYVAYGSYATTIVPNDRDLGDDVYRLDRLTGTTVRVSQSHPASPMGQKVFGSTSPAISADGRFVAYASTNQDALRRLDPSLTDVYRWDATTGVSTLVAGPGGLGSGSPALDADGDVLAFHSSASWLTGFATPSYTDQVYVWSPAAAQPTR